MKAGASVGIEGGDNEGIVEYGTSVLDTEVMITKIHYWYSWGWTELNDGFWFYDFPNTFLVFHKYQKE